MIDEEATGTGFTYADFKNEIDELKKLLLEDKTFFTTQKLIVKEQSLIDWKWVLLIIALLLSIEWFVRKYFGKL